MKYCWHKKRLVFCFENCSDPLWEKIVLAAKINFYKCKAVDQELASFFIYIIRTIYSYVQLNVKRIIFEAEYFLTGFWSFQRSDTLQ